MHSVHRFLKKSILFIIDLFYPLFRRIFSLQTFRYVACGGVNTLLDISLFAVNYHLIFRKHNVVIGTVTVSPHIASLWLAFCITLPIGYYLNRYVVFQELGLKRRVQLFRFILVTFLCIGLNYILLKLFVDYMGWYPTPSKVLTTIFVAAFSYITQAFVFFKKQDAVNPMG
ncbi:MAG: GtrA family protein [Mucilaginibacter sp.]|nr:GtrA family protein [Mucilaginibacter sp.]